MLKPYVRLLLLPDNHVGEQMKPNEGETSPTFKTAGEQDKRGEGRYKKGGAEAPRS